MLTGKTTVKMTLTAVYISFCLLASCSCRPAADTLPHSRDFYAGYIKALNDNFDTLFKPERFARSVQPAVKQASDEQPSGSKKILNEIIDDNNLQKTKDAGNKGVQKRDLLKLDINTKAKVAPKSEVGSRKSEVIGKNDNDVGTDPVQLTKNATIDDGPESGEGSYTSVDATNASRYTNIRAKDTQTESEGSSSDSGSAAEYLSADVGSGNKEYGSGDLESGSRETSTSDVGSGGMDSSEKTPASVTRGSKKTEISPSSNGIKGEVDFEDSISNSDGEKRELKGNDSNTNASTEDTMSGEKKTIMDSDVDEDEKAEEEENEDDGSGVDAATKRDKTEPNKDDEYNMDEIEYEDTVTENDDKLLEDNGNASNSTSDEENLNTALDNSSNGVQKHTIPNKGNDEGHFEVEDADDFDDDQDNAPENEGDGEAHDADESKQQEDAEHTVKKTISAEEDNTEKVANFKEDEDIEDHIQGSVSDGGDRSDRSEKETTTDYKKEHDVVASRRTIVPKTNDKSHASVKTKITHKKKKNASKKSAVGPYQLPDFPTESDLSAVTMKKIVEKVGTPVSLTREEEAEEDKELINAPEPNYKKFIPGIESATLEHSLENLNEVAEQHKGLPVSQLNFHKGLPVSQLSLHKGLPVNQERFLTPVTYYSQAKQDKHYDGDNKHYYDDSLRRHYVLAHSVKQDYPYLSSVLSGGYTHAPRDRVVPSRSDSLALPDNLIQQYSASYPVDNREDSGYHSTQRSPLYQQYEPQVAPDEQAPFESRYANHGNAHAYIPDIQATVPASARSDVMSYLQRRRHPSYLRDTLVHVPLSLVENFIQNAGRMYQSGNELAGIYPSDLLNDHTGSSRSLILSRRQYHQPVVLQPIFVLMPMPYRRSY